jgi:hypothetical protein
MRRVCFCSIMYVSVGRDSCIMALDNVRSESSDSVPVIVVVLFPFISKNHRKQVVL